ncbi:hypothetical protein [Candidatus Thiosymbion oneisti]|uniref:hypothetical protein n=1 Tax=Candidatus Thiosymbion oneisti TaxID=589554 RepID=UPI00105E6B91|nr:hypothetical protein [Candidatus Thiosymbion oneisti]
MTQHIQDNLWHGAIPYAIGQAAVLQIPIPNSGGLYIGLRTNNPKRRPTSTSTLFFQDKTGKERLLRLDYGDNPRTRTIDFHWNHKRGYAKFGIEDHTPAGRAGEIAYKSARYFRWGGRVFLVAGITADTVSIVRSSTPLNRASQVVSAWALAWAGCKAGGAGGAALGSPASPLGMAAGGIGGCIIGGLGGYVGGTVLGGQVYDWVKGTFFIPLQRTAAPHD